MVSYIQKWMAQLLQVDKGPLPIAFELETI